VVFGFDQPILLGGHFFGFAFLSRYGDVTLIV